MPFQGMPSPRSSSRIQPQVRFQPLDGFSVQVVRGLVQQEDVRLLQEEAAQRHTSPFAAGKRADLRVRRRALEGVHRPFQLCVDLPAVQVLDELRQLALAFDEAVHLVVVHGLHELHRYVIVFREDVHHFLYALLDHFDDGLVRIHLRLLREVSDGVAGRPNDFALEGLLHPGNDLEERRFTGPVEADDADLGAVEEGQVDVLENDLVVVREDLSHPVHRENDLFVSHGFVFAGCYLHKDKENIDETERFPSC